MDSDAMGTDGQAVQADVCSYTLFLPEDSSTVRETPDLQAFCAEVLAYADSLCIEQSTGKPYIWQREAFSLAPSEDGRSLAGQTSFGESVEDEWFIVYLLREISKKYQDLIIKIEDTDGQFLLIEAAEVLPSWLNPENAENRFWIYRGQLHLVPIEHTSPAPVGSEELAGFLSQSEALPLVRKPNTATQVSEAVSQAIWLRIADLPAGIKSQWHNAVAQLPLGVAQVLSQDENLISKAVQAFYERDAIQLKACQYMKRFPPSPSKLAQVRMTKALYAQMVSQRFYPPKIFEKNGYSVEYPAEATPSDQHSTAHVASKRAELGVKIACGFEILYSESAASRRKGKSTKVELGRQNEFADTERHYAQDKAYLKYLVALTKAGYFRGEIAGSSLYTQLEARAQTYWEDMQGVQAGSGRQRSSIADTIDACLAKSHQPAEEAIEGKLEALQEDDDSWLYIDEARLESMLKRQRRPVQVEEGDEDMRTTSDAEGDDDHDDDDDEKIAAREAKRLQAMAERFENFIEGKGSLEGATLDDEMSEDDEDSDGEDEDEDDGLQEDLVAGVSAKLSEKEKQARLGKLVPGLGAEEWGAEAAQKQKAAAKKAADSIPGSASSQLAEAAEAAKTSVAADDSNVSKASLAAARLSEADHLDGVSDSSDSEDEDRTKRDPFMGAGGPSINRDSLLDLDEEEDEGPLVVDGEDDFQLDESEMEEFLKFTKDALGLTEEQYSNIVENRKKRGAFVPEASAGVATAAGPQKRTASGETKPVAPVARPAESAQPASSKPRNPNLDSFEALMTAMDTELQKTRSPSKSDSATRQTSKPTRKSAEGIVIEDDADTDEDDDEDMADLDAELAAALKRGEEEGVSDGDYGLIKNFLESFKSQNGLAGPVSNMFGRLDKDFQMPRDG